MKEEKTQGIDTETTTKDSYNTNEKAKETELLDLRAGYSQHTSPTRKPPCFFSFSYNLFYSKCKLLNSLAHRLSF